MTAYALRGNSGVIKVVACNKNADRGVRLEIEVGQRTNEVRVLRLVVPRLDGTADTTLGGAPGGAGGAWSGIREEILRGEIDIWVIELLAASSALITFERD